GDCDNGVLLGEDGRVGNGRTDNVERPQEVHRLPECEAGEDECAGAERLLHCIGVDAPRRWPCGHRMSNLILVDCEAPLGVGAPSVGDMSEFGAVDVKALREGRVETFHGTDCSEDTFRRFREWLEPRSPVVFVSDNPAYDFQWINFYFWRYFGMNPFGHSGR